MRGAAGHKTKDKKEGTPPQENTEYKDKKNAPLKRVKNKTKKMRAQKD
jgi:hypothetical protein